MLLLEACVYYTIHIFDPLHSHGCDFQLLGPFYEHRVKRHFEDEIQSIIFFQGYSVSEGQ